MTKKENYYKNQFHIGIGTGLLGFIITIFPMILNYLFNTTVPFIVIVIGQLVALVGFVLSTKALIGGLKYAKSEQYKKDLVTKQPWE